MKNVRDMILIGVFMLFVFGLSVMNAFDPDQEISEIENRTLQQFPTFTWQRLENGRFMEDFETYLTDQFMVKERWVGLKSDIERLAKRRENNGIYFAKDDFLLEVFLDEGRNFNRNLEMINTFHERLPQLNTTVMLIPTAVKVHEELLPRFAPVLDQQILLDEATSVLAPTFVDVYESLHENREDYIFFRTDHHWSMRGAYVAYQQLMETWGKEPFMDYDIETISTNFYGTFFAQANNFHISPDEIELFLPQTEVDFTLQRGFNEEMIMDGLYDFTFLNKRDQYSVFLGGIGPLKIIRSNVASDEKLVVFKDSFAHNFLPFLAMHYKEIHILDLRYFNANPYAYVEQYDFDQALFLYNLSSFGTDPSLGRLR